MSDFGRYKLSPDDRRFLRAVSRGLARGKTQVEIAAELDVAPSTINQRVARLGFRIEKRLVPMSHSTEEAA